MKKEVYIGPMMKKISEEIDRQVNEGLKHYNLTFAQSRVILHLKDCGNQTCTQKQLEDWLEVSHPTTVRIVKSMQDKKMVETFTDAEDKRMKMVRLCWGDEEKYNELVENAEWMEENLLSGFSEEERKMFGSFVMRAYENVTK